MANSSYHPTRKAGRWRRRGLAAMAGKGHGWETTAGNMSNIHDLVWYRGGQKDKRTTAEAGGSISGDYLGICWNRWGNGGRSSTRARLAG